MALQNAPITRFISRPKPSPSPPPPRIIRWVLVGGYLVNPSTIPSWLRWVSTQPGSTGWALPVRGFKNEFGVWGVLGALAAQYSRHALSHSARPRPSPSLNVPPPPTEPPNQVRSLSPMSFALEVLAANEMGDQYYTLKGGTLLLSSYCRFG
jgi:hypothetical protein